METKIFAAASRKLGRRHKQTLWNKNNTAADFTSKSHNDSTSDKQNNASGKTTSKKWQNKKVKRGFVKKSKLPKEKHVARLPQSSEDLSSNWKKLLQQMEGENRNSKSKMKSATKAVNKPMADTYRKDPKVEKEIAKNNSGIWFDDVDECLLDSPSVNQTHKLRCQPKNMGDSIQPTNISSDPLVKDKSIKGFTKAIGMDCEMVGVGFKGEDSVLARVSLVNQFGHCVYDKYVKPREKVTDYRTAVSGIRKEDIENANDFKTVQKEVSEILNDRILVGHAIRHDLKVSILMSKFLGTAIV